MFHEIAKGEPKMARLPFDIWSIRKNRNPEFIVSQGVQNAEELDKFLQERGVAMPLDLADFEKIWSTMAPKVKKATVATKKTEATTKKPTKKTSTSTRSTRRKSNIKDSDTKS